MVTRPLSGKLLATTLLLVLAGAPLSAEGPCKAVETADQEGRKVVVMENDYLKLAIRPGAGGLAVSVLHKRTGLDYVGAAAGWFMDLDWSISRQSNNDYQKQIYVFDIAESGPERASVTLKGKSKIPPLDWIEVQKTLSLERDSAAIQASYCYFNHPDSMEPITVRPWIHHEFGGLGPEARYVMPLTDGRYEIRPTKAKPSSKYGKNLAQGWLGAYVPGGNGVVSFPVLKDLYQYYEWVSVDVGTLEWRLRPLEVPNGEGFKTSYLMFPFAGLRDLCGGADGVACGIVLPEGIERGKPVPWEFELISCKAQEGLSIDARVRHLSDGVWKALGKKQSRLDPDAPVKLALDPWTPDRDGTWVLQCRVSGSGERLFDAERTIVLSKATDGYQLALEGPRQEEPNLVPDPSAEWSSGKWQLRVGALDDSVAHSGRVSIKAEAVNHPEKRSIVTQKAIPVEPSTKYVISFWARCPVAKTFRVNVVSLDENQKEIQPEPRECEVHFKERSWQWLHCEASYQSRPSARFATIRIYGFGENVVFWVDDLRMVPGEPKRLDTPARTDIPYTLDVVTPHIPWARPYSRGPVKAFVLAHVSSSRDIADLAQRLELDFETVTVTGSSVHAAYASGTMGGRRMGDELRNIQEKLATRYDVIVLGGISWKWLTPKIRKALLKQLAAGTGLVYVQPNWLLDDLVDPKNYDDPKFPDELRNVEAQFPLSFPGPKRYRHRTDYPTPYRAKEHPITNGIPFRALVPMRFGNWPKSETALALHDKNHPFVAVGSYGKGRVVALNYMTGGWPYRKDAFESGKAFQRAGMCPNDYGHPTLGDYKYHYWEYFWMLLVRAAAWAAQKEPELAVVAVSPDAGGQEFAKGPLEKVGLTLQSPEKMTANVEVTFLDEYSTVIGGQEQAAEVPAGAASTVDFPVPENSPAGLVFADFVIRDAEGRSLNWAATAFENPRPARIESIELDRPEGVYSRSDTVKARIRLSEKLDGAQLLIRVTDSHGRVLFSESADAGAGEAAVAFSLNHPRSVRMKVNAALVQGERLIDRAEAGFTITPEKGPWDQYQFVISSLRASRAYQHDSIYKLYSEMGFTCVRGHLDPAMNAEHNFNYLASCPGFGHMKGKAHGDWGRYLQTGDLKNLHRVPPAYDAKKWESVERSLEAAGRSGAQFVPLIYGLSDENNLGGGECDYDYSPSTLEWFRKWLAEQYGALDALNRQWETTFKTWEEVMPMPLPVARKRGQNLSPWADHREFMDHVFVEFHARMKAAVRRGDPNAIVGVSGTQKPNAYNGYDWWQLMKVFDALLAYTRGNQPEIQRSFKRVPSVGWGGYGSRGPKVSSQLWQYLLYNKQIALWRDNLIFEPDWRVSQSGKDYAEAVKPLMRGIGKLIMQSEWVPSPVGIHYSQASIRASAGGKRESAFERARASWVALFKDLGLQPVFVSYEQLERGDLKPDKYRVFVLPESEALSEKEVAGLRKYVEGGGTLIADTRIGLRDKHCRLLPKGQLDELLGIKRTEAAGGRPPRAIELTDADWIQWPNQRLILSLADGAASVSPTTGEALASSRGVPAFICRSLGQGRTVYLNFHLTSYAAPLEEGRKFRDNFRALLRAAGVHDPCEVMDEARKPFYGCEVTVFRNGTEELVCLLADYGHFQKSGWDQRAVALDLGEKAPLYEVVTGQWCGVTAQPECELPSNMMRIYARLPGEVTEVALGGPEKAAFGELMKFPILVKARPALHDRQLVRIEAFSPDGKPCHPYSTIVWIPAAGGTHEIPLALNDAAGQWRIRVTHVVSGVSAKRSFDVTEGKTIPGPKQ